ncbi:MAG: hypothetical protein ACT4PM_14050 [Gemmatimonadales bacterium]
MRPLLAILAVAVPSLTAAQQKPAVPAIPLATVGLSGQSVAVLPLTLLLTDPAVPGTSGADARATLLRWADSLLGDLLMERAPEVGWVLPPKLRARAGASGGLVPSPDHLGQAVMRTPNLKEVPDPLRANLRQLLALAGGARYALIPAALSLAPADSSREGLAVQLAAVLTDGRTGRVMWRTIAVGQGESAEQAYRAALATMLPPPAGSPEP